MGTELQEESMAAAASNHLCFAKGKRTRRRRLHLLTAPTTSTSSSEELFYDDDEEDMANCLILLAQGRALEEDTKLKSVVDIPQFVYECKTCNKSFPSFQALGGHRASHKKLKPEDKKGIIGDGYGQSFQISMSPSRKLEFPNQKPRVHECSICGAEFSSGQALGGHMRRHRAVPAEQDIKKEKNTLCLDLNLPAPDEDDRAFSFSGKQNIVFSASALVGCHY